MLPSLSGSPDVPCVQCGRRVRGLGWAELCPECTARRRRRANRLARRISLAATVLMAGWIALRRPGDPTGQLYALVGIVAVYIIVQRIASRLAMEFLPREPASSEPRES